MGKRKKSQKGGLTLKFCDSHLQKIPLVIEKEETNWNNIIDESPYITTPEFIIHPFGDGSKGSLFTLD